MPKAEPLSPRALVSRRSVAEAKAAEGPCQGHMKAQNELEVVRLLKVLGDKAGEPSQRAEAAQALGRIPQNDKARRARIWEALCGALREDEASGVRVAAAHALESFCESRDVLAVQALVGGLSDQDGLVRRASAQALGSLAPRDRNAGARLLNLLETDREVAVRASAADALGQVAVPGDADTVSCLISHLVQDESLAVRRSAIDALSHLARPGDPQVIGPLVENLQHDMSSFASIRALGCLGNRGDAQVLQVIQQHLEADEAGLRRNAVEALTKLTADVGEDKLMALLDRVSDSDASVRVAATQALRKMAAMASPEAATTLLARLEGSGMFLLQNMGRHLDECGVEDCDERLSSFILTWMADSRSSLERLVMIQALAQVARRGDPKIVEAIVPNFEEDDGAVRAATAQALGRLATPGDQEVIAVLLRYLKDPEPPVRRTCASALGKLALDRDQICSGALWFLLQDENDAVRAAATRSMHRINASLSTPQRCLASSQSTSPASRTTFSCTV